jgi:gamma-glutamyltranspeptidase/glutathione hydrolase|eukprot:COSAG06_NODE_2474_length_6797_cov_14.954165_1_plen_303_part_00
MVAVVVAVAVLQAEAIKVSKACIYEHVGDPEYKPVPYAGLLSKAYAEHRRALISETSAMDTAEPGDPYAFGGVGGAGDSGGVASNGVAGRAAVGPGGQRQRSEVYYDSPDTTSFSVLDVDGNAVCCTPTIGEGFGTRVVCGETGMLFNNGMRIGSTSPYPENVNYVRPGQIPLLNNSPVIVLKDGKLKLAMGTPGGEAIGQTQFQCIMNVLDFELTVQEAIETPRFRLAASPNFYKPGCPVSMSLESRVPEETVEQLRSWGHEVKESGPYSICAMQGILVDFETGAASAGADPRGGYYAVGY